MASIEPKLKPWTVPNFATVEEPPRPRQEGFTEARTIPVSDLPKDVLREMAQDWLKALYDKAGHSYDWRFD
jgi:hypothetical protein